MLQLGEWVGEVAKEVRGAEVGRKDVVDQEVAGWLWDIAEIFDEYIFVQLLRGGGAGVCEAGGVRTHLLQEVQGRIRAKLRWVQGEVEGSGGQERGRVSIKGGVHEDLVRYDKGRHRQDKFVIVVEQWDENGWNVWLQWY